jgi:hypothetical protein
VVKVELAPVAMLHPRHADPRHQAIIRSPDHQIAACMKWHDPVCRRDPDHTADERIFMSMRLPGIRGDGPLPKQGNDMNNEIHELNIDKLEAVVGGLGTQDIILLRWLNQNFPELVPAVFKRTNPAHIC